MNTVFVLLLIFVMVGFNALYVAAEFATVGSRRSRVQESADAGNGRATGLLAILQDSKRLDNYVAACQIGITLSSLVAGAYGQAQLIPVFEDWFGSASPTVAVIVVLLFITTLQVVLGELLPKTVALRYPETLAVATLTPLRISQWLLRPLVAVFNGSAFAIMKRLGLHIDHSHSHVHSPSELAGLYRESAAGGLIDSAEREMLAGALAVSNRVVREIMTPRRRLHMVEASTPITDALAELSASPYTRFPVTEGGEEIVGLVTLRDLFLANEGAAAATVADVAEEPMVVSEVFEVPSLMATFSQQGIHVAIVVNEFGSVSGMVTREDAIEEVLGEFNDEFDVEPDPITITGATVSVRGDVLLTVLGERFDLDLPGDQVDTVSGYVWHHLGRLPEVGDTVPLITTASLAATESTDEPDLAPPHPELRVDAVDGTLVERVTFTLPTDADGESPT
ncbi:MAG: hemolysin family protein [Ilumatobacter sp.]|uniref:hemolysin family protein n=1 Tax=Ilumatobacter sp. TaxID=1967498 RepID=UPI00262A3793|nr:hemolysin family protein [Ilumatobacter sp.]MDJ0770460.1 hemolysin family protein [Ilumatobacter sp.]